MGDGAPKVITIPSFLVFKIIVGNIECLGITILRKMSNLRPGVK